MTIQYTDEELLTALRSGSRIITYEYTISNAQGKTLGFLDVDNAKITYDSKAEVMRTFTGTCRASDLFSMDTVDFYVMPWMCLHINDDVIKFPLGRFIIEPQAVGKNTTTTYKIVGYDLGKIALDDKVDSRIYTPSGSVYTSLALQIAGTDYEHINMDASPKTRNSDMEWEVGTSKLKIINELLNAISYNPLWFDASGTGHITQYIPSYDRSVDMTYKADKQSVILDNVSMGSNKFEVPNKFIRYVESVDSTYMIAVYTNTDVNSPYSTVNRGRTNVDSKLVKDIATQADLNTLVRKDAALAMSIVDTIQFYTLNMPNHEYQNCLYVDIPEYNISDKYIETKWQMELSQGGIMTHYCERVVNV